MVRLCYVSIFSLCSVSIFSMCYVSMHASLASLGGSSLRSLRPLRGRCGRFAAAAAASRPQAITPNIIVFIVHGLTFMNVSALGITFCRLLCWLLVFGVSSLRNRICNVLCVRSWIAG